MQQTTELIDITVYTPTDNDIARCFWWFLAGAAPIVVWAAAGICLGKVVDYSNPPSGRKIFLGLKPWGTITLGTAATIGAILTISVILYGACKSFGSVEEAKKALGVCSVFTIFTLGPVSAVVAAGMGVPGM